MMKWKRKIILIFILILLLISNSGASKEIIKEIDYGVSETVTLNSGDYIAYSFSLWENYGINVTIEVLEGGNIDTFLISSEEFPNYQSIVRGNSGKFSYRADSEGLNIKSKYYSYTDFSLFTTLYKSPTNMAKKDYYIVIDNTNQPKDGAVPSGSVTIKIKIDEVYDPYGAIKRLDEEKEEKRKLNESFHPNKVIQEIELDSLDETKTINKDEYLVYSFLAEDKEKINISIRVINGGAIDTFLMNSEWFLNFQSAMEGSSNRDYRTYMTSQGENIKSKSYTFIFDHSDRYFLIVDNTLKIGEAKPSEQVDIEIKIIKETPNVSGMEIIFGILSLLLIYKLKHR